MDRDGLHPTLGRLTNLAPGEYRLLLRGSNRSGAWSETVISLPIRVLPDGQILHKTCSLGLAAYPFIPNSIDSLTWEQVIDIADQCFSAAKHGGRNAWARV